MQIKMVLDVDTRELIALNANTHHWYWSAKEVPLSIFLMYTTCLDLANTGSLEINAPTQYAAKVFDQAYRERISEYNDTIADKTSILLRIPREL